MLYSGRIDAGGSGAVLLHLDRAVSPKDLYQETCTVTSYQFTENDDGDKRLELELPGYTAAFYTWGIEPDSAKMAQIEQEIADKVTFTVSFPKTTRTRKTSFPSYSWNPPTMSIFLWRTTTTTP